MIKFAIIGLQIEYLTAGFSPAAREPLSRICYVRDIARCGFFVFLEEVYEC